MCKSEMFTVILF